MRPAFLALARGIPDPLILLGKAGDVLAANPGALAEFPALASPASGPLPHALGISPAEDFEQYLRLCWRSAAALPGGFKVVAPSGPVRYRCSGWCWNTEAGRALVLRVWRQGGQDPFLVLKQKIDELTLENLRRRQTERALQEALRVRDDFISVAAHELRTPLSALFMHVDGALRVLTRNPAELAGERGVAKWRNIQKQVDRLHRLIEALLDVSRINAGKLELAPEEADLAELTRTVAERFSSEFQLAGAPLRVDCAEPVPGIWDTVRLEQVLVNLLSNAAKYGRGHPVEVSVRTTGQHAVLQVRDQGIGIAPEDQVRIFERFERAAPNRSYGGLGVGLWITRNIVRAMGGEIRVESAVGRGATFTVELPRP